MNTFFIANNKTRIASIYETDKSRQDVIDTLNFNDYDIIITCDNTQHALELRTKGDYQLTHISDFQ